MIIQRSLSFFGNVLSGKPYLLLDRKLKKSILKQSYINSVRSEYYGEAGDVIDTKYIDSLSLKEKYGLIYNKISLFHPKILVVKSLLLMGICIAVPIF